MRSDAAEAIARQTLAPLGRRFAHVAAVAELSQKVADRLKIDPDLLVSAAWLHDVGYSPQAVDTAFHPLDGARFLREMGVPDAVVNLVAHHSYALLEAKVRGLPEQLIAEFPRDPSLPHDELCYCDMTTGPSGERITVDERLSEIRARYGPGDLVTRFILQAEAAIVETVDRIEKRLTGTAQSK